MVLLAWKLFIIRGSRKAAQNAICYVTMTKDAQFRLRLRPNDWKLNWCSTNTNDTHTKCNIWNNSRLCTIWEISDSETLPSTVNGWETPNLFKVAIFLLFFICIYFSVIDNVRMMAMISKSQRWIAFFMRNFGQVIDDVSFMIMTMLMMSRIRKVYSHQQQTQEMWI